MTPEQFDRFRDFALRMAKTCYKGHKRPTRKWIVDAVTDFIDGLDAEEIPCIQNWDNSAPYAEGTRYYSRTYKCRCWDCHGTPKKPDCRCKCEDGSIFDCAEPYCMGDMMSEWATVALENLMS